MSTENAAIMTGSPTGDAVCWRCERKFAEVKDLRGEGQLFINCPRCKAKNRVTPAPY